MGYANKICEFTGLNFLICKVCGNETHPWQSYVKDDEVKCPECAFRKGNITEVEFCNLNGGIAWFTSAGINPITGEIEYTSGRTIIKWVGRGVANKKRIEYRKSRSKFTWEMTDKEARHCGNYIRMKKRVMERDGSKCVKCGAEGNLHTHHIKSFKHHKELRFIDSNVITVCIDCHKQEHKKR